MCEKLLGSLSVKRGRSVSGTRGSARYSVRQKRESPAAELADGFRILRLSRRNRPVETAISPSTGSSSVPSTWLWLARICSISVEPERGKPTMKIGSSDANPWPACCSRNSRLNTSSICSWRSRIPLDRRTPAGAAAGCRPDSVPRRGRNRRHPRTPWRGRTGNGRPRCPAGCPPELPLHGRDLFRLEPEHLEVGHAPVHLTEVGLERNRAAILLQGLSLPAQSLQNVRMTHVDAGQPG